MIGGLSRLSAPTRHIATSLTAWCGRRMISKGALASLTFQRLEPDRVRALKRPIHLDQPITTPLSAWLCARKASTVNEAKHGYSTGFYSFVKRDSFSDLRTKLMAPLNCRRRTHYSQSKQFPSGTFLIASGRLDRWYYNRFEPMPKVSNFVWEQKTANHLISQFVCRRNKSMPSTSWSVSIITAGRNDQRLLNAFPSGTRTANRNEFKPMITQMVPSETRYNASVID